MRYLGGKSRIAEQITNAILENSSQRCLLVEPFIGGGAITSKLAPYFNKVEASDIHEDLVLMWKALLSGWIPPSVITEDEYKALRNAEPSALRGFVGFGCSFGGKYFGGYARYKDENYAAISKRSVLKQIKTMTNVLVQAKDYREIFPPSGAVVYVDPPYAGTTGYGLKFDSVEFWQTMTSWHNKGAMIFCSEYTAPPGWIAVWEKPLQQTLRGDLSKGNYVTEKLWIRQ